QHPPMWNIEPEGRIEGFAENLTPHGKRKRPEPRGNGHFREVQGAYASRTAPSDAPQTPGGSSPRSAKSKAQETKSGRKKREERRSRLLRSSLLLSTQHSALSTYSALSTQSPLHPSP